MSEQSTQDKILTFNLKHANDILQTQLLVSTLKITVAIKKLKLTGYNAPFVAILQKAQLDSDNIIFIRKQVFIAQKEHQKLSIQKSYGPESELGIKRLS